MRVVTADQMKQMERNALGYDLTFHRLMENAGSAAAAYIRRTFRVEGRNCIIFCGKGNNGGDGLVAARKLAENGVNILVALTGGKPSGEEASAMYTQLEMMGVPIIECAENSDRLLRWLGQTDLIVEAICGTGFKGELRKEHREACRMINEAAAAVVSLDIPAGLECDTGAVAKGAVRADYTLCFDSLKPAHFLPFSKEMCGTVEVLNIGIPEEARNGVEYRFGSLSAGDVFDMIPRRAPDSHKGDYGRLLNISGSLRYRGAALLSTLAALRCGVGIVTLASCEAVCAAVVSAAPEAVLLPIENTDPI
ncbi:MAG: NAD(P)H-hydrate epimerase, partial [Oscillospiraceae bacterium]|nr:NAD(P)H-hydrate epimerase [Oscillospiraceae bacterium]